MLRTGCVTGMERVLEMCVVEVLTIFDGIRVAVVVPEVAAIETSVVVAVEVACTFV